MKPCRPPIGCDDERAHGIKRPDETGKIVDPQRDMPARGQDALDNAGSQARNAQKRLARSAVDVDRKQSPVAQSPGELGVALEIEHAIARSIKDFLGREAVEAHQPVGLIKTMLTHQRRTPQRQALRGVRNRAEGGIVDAPQTV